MTTVAQTAPVARRLTRHHLGRIGVAVGLAAVLVAACGGTLMTPMPTVAPTTAPAATSTDTAASATPGTTAAAPETTFVVPSIAASPDTSGNGGYAFAARDVMAYYTNVGFTCAAPTASTQATGYQVTRCVKDDSATGTSTLVGLVTDPSGILGDAFAGYVNTSGTAQPALTAAAPPLLTFLGAMLGETAGTEAGNWLVQHLGEQSAQTMVGAMTVVAYTTADSTSSSAGLWTEVANQAFLDAPTP